MVLHHQILNTSNRDPLRRLRTNRRSGSGRRRQMRFRSFWKKNKIYVNFGYIANKRIVNTINGYCLQFDCFLLNFFYIKKNHTLIYVYNLTNGYAVDQKLSNEKKHEWICQWIRLDLTRSNEMSILQTKISKLIFDYNLKPIANNELKFVVNDDIVPSIKLFHPNSLPDQAYFKQCINIANCTPLNDSS